MREQSPTERMHNLSFRLCGSSMLFIRPARRCILSILQTVRGSSAADCIATEVHFHNRQTGV